MKPANAKLLVFAVLLTATTLFAQDIQEMYESAKRSLQKGDYLSTLETVAQAKREIALDANLDPNRVFSNRLLPKIEQSANAMASLMRALEALYDSQVGMAFPELPATRGSVEQLTQLAKTSGEELLRRRERILAETPLAPEYLDTVLKSPQYRRIEQLATVGVIEQLSQKLSVMVGTLTDSLQLLNSRYDATAAALAKLQKASAADKAEREKLEKELAMISQQRLNYMMTVSEMLTGQTSEENPQLRMVMMDENIDQVFTNVIYSEVERIGGLSEVDSTGYRELVANYERIKKYNQIFVKNGVARDQSELLANYEKAIQRIRVVEPRRFRFLPYVLIFFSVLILLLLLIKLIATIRRRRQNAMPENRPNDQSKR